MTDCKMCLLVRNYRAQGCLKNFVCCAIGNPVISAAKSWVIQTDVMQR
jgi:hypothetical protein